MEEGYVMKRIAKRVTAAYDYEISKEELQDRAKIAEEALVEFRAVAKRYANIYDHMDPLEFKMLDRMLETLQDVKLGVYVQFPDEDTQDNHII